MNRKPQRKTVNVTANTVFGGLMILLAFFLAVGLARCAHATTPETCAREKKQSFDCFMLDYPHFDAAKDLSRDYRKKSCEYFAANSNDEFWADAYVGYNCWDFGKDIHELEDAQ